MAQFQPRELNLLPQKKEGPESEMALDSDFAVESVDQIVYNQLQSIDSEMIDTKILTDIYKDL